MQTILGAGGAIGIDLAKALLNYTPNIRLVSRNPHKVNPTDNLFEADLRVAEQVDQAVAGSEVCYLTVGLPYKTTVWQEEWPRLMKNVATACMKHNCKLVFFDNVYAIGGDNVNHITEDSPLSPTSKKGEVRAELNRYLLNLMETGQLQAIIARAPDFFGPVKDTSMLMISVYDNLSRGKKAQWFANADVPHTMGYTRDLAIGTAMLGNREAAYNQIWNLPTDPNALTGRQWVALFAELMRMPDKTGVQVLPVWLVKTLGLFIPILKETSEMLYQYDREYYFDSSKFIDAFNFEPTSNREAVRQTLGKLRG